VSTFLVIAGPFAIGVIVGAMLQFGASAFLIRRIELSLVLRQRGRDGTPL
jgi:hypothetical protein